MQARRLGLSLLVLAACGPNAPPAAPIPPAPTVTAPPVPPPRKAPVIAAARKPVVTTYFGVSVTDDYAWMEDAKAPETQAFTDAENALMRQTIDAMPERAAIKDRLTAIMSATSPDWFMVKAQAGHYFALKNAPPKQQSMLVDLGTKVDAPTEKVIVDPNALDPSGKTTIDWYVPSPDGKLVAVSLSSGGSESGDVHLIEIATGKDKNDTVSGVQKGTAGGSVAWNADGSGFWHTRYPKKGERPDADLDFYQQVYFHKLGTPETSDTYAVGKEFPRVAEVELERSDDGKLIVAHVKNGDGGDAEHHVLDNGKWTRLTKFEDGMTASSFGPDGKVYLVSRNGAPHGKVVAFAAPWDKPATEVVPESDGVIEDAVVTKDAIYTIEIVDGPSRVRRYPLGAKAEPLAQNPAKKGKPAAPTTVAPGERGSAAAELPLPPVSAVQGAVKVGQDVLLRVESYLEPPKWLLYRANEHRFVPTPLARKAAYDMSDVEVVRESCTSKDGTKVPMSVLRKKSAPKAPAPAFLTGYGGFNVTIKPRLRASYRVWLDAGGVVAETNLRGGGERGEAWHKAGSLTNKQNVFDDFAACAKAMTDLGYTTPQKLAISGRSNGGLLMGAELTQHPDMFKVVTAGVGIHDMLHYELTPNGAFNITEYGTVKNEDQFKAIYAYSPLHNVKDDVQYPPVLFFTGANDPRVDPYNSRKMVARLQYATANLANPPAILLRANADVGHGMGSPLSAEIDEQTDVLTFMAHAVGAHL